MDLPSSVENIPFFSYTEQEEPIKNKTFQLFIAQMFKQSPKICLTFKFWGKKPASFKIHNLYCC